MPPDMAVSMRHTKLKAEEAALLMGELKKPTWESRNEGIHERVSFEDTIWGFDLAGGSYYKTPLRVTHVKEDSRAAKAGIRPGDKLKRINDIDTSTLTIQEAHAIILESGIHLKIAVTAPEDEEDAYFCYEDPLDTGYDSDEERRREEERARKRQVHARVSSYWSLQWPWVSKRRVIYRESNCFMVPSKYETKHKEKFPEVPFLRTSDDVVLDSLKNVDLKNAGNQENTTSSQELNNVPNGIPKATEIGAAKSEEIKPEGELLNYCFKKLLDGEAPVGNQAVKDEANKEINTKDLLNGDVVKDEKHITKQEAKEKPTKSEEHVNNLSEIPEVDEEKIPLTPEPQDDSTQELSEPLSESQEDNTQEISEADSVNIPEVNDTPIVAPPDEVNGEVEAKDDDVIDGLLNDDGATDLEEDQILDSILSESQEEESVDER